MAISYYALPEHTGITSLDEGYETKDLSVFNDPEYPDNVIDSKKNLYDVQNNAETTLKQALSYAGRNIVVEDATAFPSQGLIRIGPQPGVQSTGSEGKDGEIIYYGSKTESVFRDLKRGFVGTRQNHWEAGHWVSNAVMAEHHNAVKDAMLTIEDTVGTTTGTVGTSLYGKIRTLERKHLSPQPAFRAYPISGAPALTVNFHTFANYDVIRFLWDFGDGSTSIERNPTHVYRTEGHYSVRLHVVTPTGAQGISTKNNYIKVDDKDSVAFFYAEPTTLPVIAPSEFLFVDQTDGNIVQRYWVFDDGTANVLAADPNDHTILHTYENAGTYEPSLLLVYADQKLKRIHTEQIVVE